MLQNGLTNCIEPAFLKPGGSARLTNGAFGKVKLPVDYLIEITKSQVEPPCFTL